MKHNKYFPLVSAVIIASSCSNHNNISSKDSPNILLIVVDDLGWADLECYGSEIHETPNINQLAKNGIRFTNAYASCPVCSPSRASIMTGKYPTSVNITDYIPGKQASSGVLPKYKFIVPEFNQQLPHKEVTIAEKLKAIGYKTIHIGKWHLGGEGFLPTDQGFDINIARYRHGMPGSYFYPYCNDDRCVENLDLKDKDSLYLTDRLTNEAVRLIEENKNNKFFMYLPFYSVHTPIEGKPELIEYYKKKIEKNPQATHQFANYAAMVQCVDDNIGRIISTLTKLNILDNTLIIFTSDNGGLKKNKYVTNNFPLRAGKGTAYEGGIRIPTIITWKNHVKEPGRDNDEMICSIDLFPFIMSVTGIDDNTSEGLDLMPIIENNGKLNRNTLYWHYPHYHLTKPVGAIRSGNYKLIEYFEDNSLELYDLSNDISESNDISNQYPEKVNELHQMLIDWRKKTNAKMPTLNPNWDSTQVYEVFLK